MKEIPIPYQVILKRLNDAASVEDIVAVGKFRLVLTCSCRIPKNLATASMNEMRDNGWIEILGPRSIKIIAKPDIDLMYRHKGQVFRSNQEDLIIQD